ncbi:hypothetical protein BsWGS_01202 [Bradybaena similaris]
MDGLSRLVFLIIFSQLGHSFVSREPTLKPFPLGTIGCLVSDVCEKGEICTNDLLFGSCQNIFSRQRHRENRYQLSTLEIERLEDEIRRLIESGFTWKDAYTQCTLQNTLVEFSQGRIFDRKLCEEALVSTDWTQDVNSEIARVLLQALEAGEVDLRDIDASQSEAEEETNLLNSNKRDEIVQVHKYFDKSTGQLKRDPFFDDTVYPYENSDNQKYTVYSPESLREDADKDTYQFLESSDRNDDLHDQDPPPESLESRDLMPFQNNNQLKDVEKAAQRQDDQSEGRASIKGVIERLVLTPEDEFILEGLLEGTISPKDLTEDQQRRLQTFIQDLILVLGSSSKRVNLVDDEEEDAAHLDMPSADDANVSENPADPNNDEAPPVGEIPTDQQPIDVDNLKAERNLIKAALVNPDVQVDKKTIDEQAGESEKERESDDRSVDTHTMYLVLSKEVNASSAEQFVQNLTEMLRIPPGLVQLLNVGPGAVISLKVLTDPDGIWDAEKIAREAENAKDRLEKLTGVRVEGEGVDSDGNRVEVKQDNRYVVPTFALVGTIAGVVLTVVGIYLCKRHSRSKQKLAQLATNGDGNEASKDYQDLCRQRMQGKSSEKPEPLHAASRIGSVSESQVRSPSSRSSTSSWSEEPAATNMDISTGHIVLSYMEDHLKNQDRLDREWEAVSSYVADPCSIKVATDQSNMRKNRFADILPYDHSRVILSSNSNVSNSDYVNANFITDHDPRNPAYIATQGPLPHTVADFWQMIWEQGSVVIVMLTKLVENGTSLCHRYWPEEGSDLYHIYEVHLVSEHIWCDDYLVRSFYLKNLQTNETRTVTQFHFLTWPELSVPASIKALLDFRRKVNKSFRGRSCPIVVHCSDGCGRTGTYCLIDMVLNKMAKGTKEIDMAATLEHIRDQRMAMVKTKEQFQFSLAAVAEEVHAILKALPQ